MEGPIVGNIPSSPKLEDCRGETYIFDQIIEVKEKIHRKRHKRYMVLTTIIDEGRFYLSLEYVQLLIRLHRPELYFDSARALGVAHLYAD